jgi:hypothetical protein
MQLAVQPDSQRRRFDTDAVDAIREALESGADRRRLCRDLPFPDSFTVLVDYAKARFFQSHIQSDIQFHGDLPL